MTVLTSIEGSNNFDKVYRLLSLLVISEIIMAHVVCRQHHNLEHLGVYGVPTT